MLPRKFQFETGGFFSDSYSLEWDGAKLWRYEMETPCIPPLADSGLPINPTLQQWQEFEKGLNEIGAYDWKRDYREEHVTDGDYIEIWITFKKRIRCSCYHLEPPNFGLFLDLINELTKNSPKEKNRLIY